MKKITPTFTGVALAIGQSPNANTADLKRTYDAGPVSLIRADNVWGLKEVLFVLVSVKASSSHLVTQGHQQMFFLG
ncbi:hypothetical protein [Marinomonas primoryensis]|jgi:hypothetical protein|uniref:hypothetical protein n=1 Tax=Marinomonas primoryensis TaxID=178399 RepID=UPI00370448B4